MSVHKNDDRFQIRPDLAVPQMSSNSPWGSLPELYTLMEPSYNENNMREEGPVVDQALGC